MNNWMQSSTCTCTKLLCGEVYDIKVLLNEGDKKIQFFSMLKQAKEENLWKEEIFLYFSAYTSIQHSKPR